MPAEYNSNRDDRETSKVLLLTLFTFLGKSYWTVSSLLYQKKSGQLKSNLTDEV